MFTDKEKLLQAYSSLMDTIESEKDTQSTFKVNHLLKHPYNTRGLSSVVNNVLANRKQKKIISLCKTLEATPATFMAEMSDNCSNAANFDWNCNPAASEGQIAACEMLRKLANLNESFSFAQGGLELFLPHINEALLLCYHSTTYRRKMDSVHKLVAYGIDDPLHKKPFYIRNCFNLRPTQYTDQFRTTHDVFALRNTMLEDQKNGLIPHFLICPVSNLSTMSQTIDSYQKLAKEVDLNLFVDLSPLGPMAMTENCCQSIKSDFVYFDMSEASHLSSGILYLRDKANYEKNIVNPHQEYLQQPKSNQITNSIHSVQQNENSLSKPRFDAHDFIIGFSNYVSWQKYLLFVMSKGKKGIREALQIKKDNIALVSEFALKSNLVEEIKLQDNYIVAKLKINCRQLFVKYKEEYQSSPFELLDTVSEELIQLHVPLLTRIEPVQISGYFKILETFEMANPVRLQSHQLRSSSNQKIQTSPILEQSTVYHETTRT